MQSMLLTAPILPGKLPTWQRWASALLGERRDEYQRALEASGLDRLRVWHQQAPDGSDTAIVLYEGATPERFLGHIAQGTDAFTTWFRAQVAECHGIDFTQPMPPPPARVIDIGTDAA